MNAVITSSGISAGSTRRRMLPAWWHAAIDAVSRAVTPYGLFTIAACCLGILVFHALEWNWLRHFDTRCLGQVFAFMDGDASFGRFWVQFNGARCDFSSDCTYVEWILCAAPFVWRRQRSFIENIVWLAGMATVVTAANLVRLCLAVLLSSRGYGWFWAHDIADDILCYPTLIAVMLAWLFALRKHDASKEMTANDGCHAYGRIENVGAR